MNNRDSHLAGLFWLLLLAQTLAVGKNTPWGALPVELGRILWVGASAFVLLLFFLKRLPSPNGFRSRAALITWTTLNFAYLGMSAFRFAPMGYEFP
jgi:hypothetical protein